jgi:REP element-mobilizing transposase RayT
MARGNRRETIFHDDDDDRRFFLATLSEACAMTGWRVHAWVLMGNHYHLFIETPEANLVAGMSWLQNTLTRRYNVRHMAWGRLFGDRYKAIVVEGADAYHYRTLADYIHLNPVRARLVLPKRGQSVLDYPWSSLAGGWALPPGKRAKWPTRSGHRLFQRPSSQKQFPSNLWVTRPVDAGEMIATIQGARAAGVLTEKEIRRTVQDMLDIVPRETAKTMPPVRIALAQYVTDAKGHRVADAAGSFSWRGGKPVVQVATDALVGLKVEARRREMRRLLQHELSHWLHQTAGTPAADEWRTKVAAHFEERTKDKEIKIRKGVPYKEGGWWHWYAGKVDEKAGPAPELVSMHLELWETPEKLQKLTNPDQATVSAFKETFALANSIFDQS